MKNITIALDDETYGKARIAAAQRDASVSALVKKYLLTLATETPAPRDLNGLLDAGGNEGACRG